MDIFETIFAKRVTAENIISAVADVDESLTMTPKQKNGMVLAIVGEIQRAYGYETVDWSRQSSMKDLGNGFLGKEEFDEHRMELKDFNLLIIVKTRFAYNDYQYCQISLYEKV